jgi:hypothetical protein
LILKPLDTSLCTFERTRALAAESDFDAHEWVSRGRGEIFISYGSETAFMVSTREQTMSIKPTSWWQHLRQAFVFHPQLDSRAWPTNDLKIREQKELVEKALMESVEKHNKTERRNYGMPTNHSKMEKKLISENVLKEYSLRNGATYGYILSCALPWRAQEEECKHYLLTIRAGHRAPRICDLTPLPDEMYMADVYAIAERPVATGHSENYQLDDNYDWNISVRPILFYATGARAYDITIAFQPKVSDNEQFLSVFEQRLSSQLSTPRRSEESALYEKRHSASSSTTTNEPHTGGDQSLRKKMPSQRWRPKP